LTILAILAILTMMTILAILTIPYLCQLLIKIGEVKASSEKRLKVEENYCIWGLNM